MRPVLFTVALRCILAAAVLAGSACGGPPDGVNSSAPEAFAVATSAARAGGLAAPCRGPLPSAALALPTGNELDFALGAVGVQIYACSATATGPAWVFSAPEADLFDRAGHLVGTHYAGPTWEARDGSKVVGARLAGATADPTAIPWLLLRAAAHLGDGQMTEVTYVQRVATVGGLAPASGCDATSVGAVARVPYTATYCFAEGE